MATDAPPVLSPQMKALDRLLEEVAGQKQAGDLERAMALLEKAPEGLRELGQYWYALGALRFEAGALDSAIEALERSVSLENEMPEYRSNLGAALVRRYESHGRDPDDLRLAREHLEAATEAGPIFPFAHTNLGHVYALEQDHLRALAAFDEALRRDPRHVAALFNRAAALRALGRNEACLEALDAVLALAPDFEPARSSRAIVVKALRGRGSTDD